METRAQSIHEKRLADVGIEPTPRLVHGLKLAQELLRPSTTYFFRKKNIRGPAYGAINEVIDKLARIQPSGVMNGLPYYAATADDIAAILDFLGLKHSHGKAAV